MDADTAGEMVRKIIFAGLPDFSTAGFEDLRCNGADPAYRDILSMPCIKKSLPQSMSI
ncbi:hypothetical cytosolic protein [Syntrophus aciditrophicus SB]|uniref:Hypothetical cytosolic protein n=1 Tax=Syntrophus aciditrophicus (strain SB) TaxID=56780 RepID=Q2LRQ7_SYNAS|nr:hypothetical cytosolic protein [Syntrophus aciditrophicus SB]